MNSMKQIRGFKLLGLISIVISLTIIVCLATFIIGIVYKPNILTSHQTTPYSIKTNIRTPIPAQSKSSTSAIVQPDMENDEFGVTEVLLTRTIFLLTRTSIPSTSTPLPTYTPTKTPEPTPIILSGTDNAIVSIDKWDGPALIHIKGKPQDWLFTVKGEGFYVSNNVDGLPYDGVRLLDGLPGFHTEQLEIEAEGVWAIEIYPLTNQYIGNRLLSAPTTYEGNGDDVLFLEDGSLYRVIITGNTASRNFSIWAYSDFVFDIDLLVNTTDTYKGTVDLPEWVKRLEIEAEGPWSLELTTR